MRHVLRDASRLGTVIDGMSHGDAIVRMRCADVAEKVSASRPRWLDRHKDALLGIARQSRQQEVRWHLAQMLPRLVLSPREKQAVIALLFDYLGDESRIVRTFSMTALAELAAANASLRRRLIPVVEKQAGTGSPAVRSRARKLLIPLRGG